MNNTNLEPMASRGRVGSSPLLCLFLVSATSRYPFAARMTVSEHLNYDPKRA